MHVWAKIWQDATYNYTAHLMEQPSVISNGINYKVNYKLPNDEAKVEVKFTIRN